MILAHPYIPAGIVDSAPLADQYVAGPDYLATELLETKTFALGFTTVFRTTLTFLMCHNLFPPEN
jgi:hypothetical protein